MARTIYAICFNTVSEKTNRQHDAFGIELRNLNLLNVVLKDTFLRNVILKDTRLRSVVFNDQLGTVCFRGIPTVQF